ncbi:MAG: heat-inducible transcriptional repressor HrcA [Candidatus Coprovivens sp.]
MNDRRNELLKEIVESYINTVKPVGSKNLCKKFKLSSATIRNEMAELEKLGYLEKNHVSSGRVPSEAGYKYYVDHLMKPKELNGEEMLKLQTIFNNQQLQVSDAIVQCMEIISELTNYTSVVLGKSSSDNTLQQVSIVPIEDNKIVALVCTNKGIVENKKFILPENIYVGDVVKTCEIINKMLVGTPITEVSKRLEFEIKPVISRTIKQYETIYSIFHDAFDDFTKSNSNVFFSGKTNILKQPEYSSVDEVKKIISKFENESLVRKIEENDDGINVYIGDDNEFDSNVTVIKSKYNINGEEGTLAIVGPKRMEYDKVIGMLEYINNEIGKNNNK